MSSADLSQRQAPSVVKPVNAGLLYALRLAIVAQAAGLVVAGSLAGQSVATDGALAETHVMSGMVLHLIGLVQIVLAVLVWRPGRGAGWPALASVVLFLAGMAQHFTWELLGTHLPNGILMFGLATALLIWSWSPGVSRRR